MSIVRGRVWIADLPQTTIYAGAPTDLRFKDGKVVDRVGREVRTRPMFKPNFPETGRPKALGIDAII